jgi:hypothetical protein
MEEDNNTVTMEEDNNSATMEEDNNSVTIEEDKNSVTMEEEEEDKIKTIHPNGGTNHTPIIMASTHLEHTKLNCIKCNNLLTTCGSNDNSPWKDKTCITCNINYEIKSMNTKGTTVSNDGFLKLKGGNYNNFTELEIKPTLIVIIYNMYEYMDTKDIYRAEVLNVRYYHPDYYSVSRYENHKSLIYASNIIESYSNVEFEENIIFEIDMSIVKESMVIVDESIFLHGDTPLECGNHKFTLLSCM